jgi:hypothetical protein
MARAKDAAGYRHDNPKEFVLAFVESLKGDDRSVAIASAAHVDYMLERILRFHFLGAEAKPQAKAIKEVLGNLFGPVGPLGAFSVKIDMCLVLGIVGPVAHQNLKRIRDIRNKFAHQVLLPDRHGKLAGLSFGSRSIADSCDQLAPMPGWFFDKLGDARKQYCQVCAVVIAALTDYMQENEKPQPPKAALP